MKLLTEFITGGETLYETFENENDLLTQLSHFAQVNGYVEKAVKFKNVQEAIEFADKVGEVSVYYILEYLPEPTLSGSDLMRVLIQNTPVPDYYLSVITALDESIRSPTLMSGPKIAEQAAVTQGCYQQALKKLIAFGLYKLSPVMRGSYMRTDFTVHDLDLGMYQNLIEEHADIKSIAMAWYITNVCSMPNSKQKK